MINQIEKYCPRCKETKKREFWGKCKTRYDGLQVYCRTCQEIIRKDYAEEHNRVGRERYRNSPEERERVRARTRIRERKKAEERIRPALEQHERIFEEWKNQLPDDVLERYGLRRSQWTILSQP